MSKPSAYLLTRGIHRTALVMLATLLSLTGWAQQSVAAGPGMQMLRSHVRQVVAQGRAQRLGTVPAGQRMKLSITLPLRNQNELTALLAELSDPASPNYRHYLTVAEFTERFGPPEQDYQSVVDFARANGFTVRQQHVNRLVLDIEGTTAQVEQAFHVGMNVYQHPTENRTFFSPDREPTLNLSVPIAHIAGLNNYSVPHPLLKKAAVGQAVVPATGSGPGGQFLGGDMRAAYYLNTLPQGVTPLTGAGQTVAVFEFDGYTPSDVTASFAGVPYSVPVNNVLIDGASAATDTINGDTEQVVDIAQAIEMAPGLDQVLVYIGPLTDNGFGLFTDTDIFSRIATDNIAKQIGVSWGWTPDDASVDDPIFQEMAAQGQTIFVATGDSGAYPDLANFPADDPYVVAVGGTDLATSGPGGSWLAETAWPYSGGGPSPDSLPIPLWQQGLANQSNAASQTLRNAPDVAAEANTDNYACGSAYINGVLQSACGGGLGGTSLAAPRWAAFLALANQQSVANGNSTIGNLSPVLYSLALDPTSYGSDFHDIVSGNNNNGQGQSYNAVTGYDLVTGLGSPNGQNMIDALAGRPRAMLTPSSLSFGYQAVNIASSSQAATYTNVGSATANLAPVVISGIDPSEFALAGTATSCPYAGGTVAPGASCTIDVEFKPTVGGSRSATVWAGDNIISVSGTGTYGAGVGTLAPTSLAFVNQPASTGAIQSAKVTNTGTAAITFTSIAVAGGSAANFTLASTATSCPYGGGSLTAGAYCTIDVQFAAPPASTATLTGSVQMIDNIGIFNGVVGTSPSSLTQTLSLSGNAILGPGVGTLAPTAINFGNQHINGTVTKSSLLTNTGTLPISFSSVTLSGTNQSNFALVTTGTSCPYSGGTVAPGASCTIDVRFMVPSAASSALTATVVLSDNIGFLNGGFTTLTQTVPITGQATSAYPIPLIDASLEPVAAIPGSAGFNLTISGTGFYPASVVQWNGSALTTTYVSGTSIAAAVPPQDIATAGTASITVKNPAPGGGVSNVEYFVVTYPTTAVTYANAPGSPFSPAGEQGGPNVVAVADLNRDGKQDLVVGNVADTVNTGSTFEILLGNGNGTFTSKAAYVGSTGFIGLIPDVLVGDFNGDGIPDLAVLDFENSNVGLWLGNGDGTFTLKSTTHTGNGIVSAAAADFNGDGKLDLAVGSDNLSILLGNGDGTFTQGAQIAVPSSDNTLVSLVVGDFNNDGQVDIAAACGDACVNVFLGNNDGTFSSPIITNIGGDGGGGGAVAADFNGDGNLDLAVTNSTGAVYILSGKGDGTFTISSSLSPLSEPSALTTGDFNGDGILDLAATNSYQYPNNTSPSTISVFLGKGDGTFQPQVQSGVGIEPFSIATGDFTGNGRLGLAVANASEYLGGLPTSVSVLVQPAVPAASLDQPSLTFSPQAQNTNSAPQTVKLSNTGGAPLIVTSVVASTNFTTTTNCVTLSPLSPGTSCTESVTFDPTTTGPLTGSLTFTDNNGGQTGSTQSVSLSGTGLSATTSTTVSCAACTPSPAYGTSLTFTAVVSPSSSSQGTPTGSIGFSVDSSAPVAGTAAACPGGSPANSLCATYTTGTLTAIGHSVEAVYTPSGAFQGSNGSTTVTVTQAPTSISGSPTASALTFGQTLAASTLSGGTAISTVTNAAVPGTFTFTTTTTAPPAGSSSQSVTFTPTDSTDYLPSTGSVNVHANPATPTVTWPTASAITFGQTLAAVTLTGGSAIAPYSNANVTGTFAFTTPGTAPVAGVQSQSVTFTPSNTSQYSPVTSTVSVLVNRAPAKVTILPAASSINYGQTLASSALSGGKVVSTITGVPVPGVFFFTSPATAPSTTGSQSVTFTPSDANNYLGTTVSVSVTVIPVPIASISPSAGINFGTLYQGSIVTKNVTIANIGNAAMAISAPLISIVSGGDSSEFVSVNLCPKSLAAGKSCTMTVTFLAGPLYKPQTATLKINDNAAGSPQLIPLTATVINPIAQLGSGSVSFGTVKTNTGSASKSITVTSAGGTALSISKIAIAGTNPGDFSETDNCAGKAFKPKATCSITVTFKPHAKGSRFATLVVTDNAFNSPQSILLSGTGN